MRECRQCTKCGLWLPLCDYQRNGGGLRPECRACLKAIRHDREFARRAAGNPTPPPLGTQACACCNVVPNHVLQFDHTGSGPEARFRGWCCRPCNQFLLAFSNKLYIKAAIYKAKHAATPASASRGVPGAARDDPAAGRTDSDHTALPRRSPRIAGAVAAAAIATPV